MAERKLEDLLLTKAVITKGYADRLLYIDTRAEAILEIVEQEKMEIDQERFNQLIEIEAETLQKLAQIFTDIKQDND